MVRAEAERVYRGLSEQARAFSAGGGGVYR